MLRILKFIGAFLGTFFLIFLIVFGFNMDALLTLFENSEDIQEGQEWVAKTSSLKGLTEYIGAQPERVSIASIAINNPDSSLLYNEHTPRTMGRLANIFLVIEYARQLEEGELKNDEQVLLSDVDTYLLPFIDESNHTDAIASLKEQGKISDSNTVAIADVIQIAVEFNDLAASDYLLFKFGRDKIASLMDKLKLEQTELPLPFSGLYIALNPSLHDADFKQWMDSLSNMQRPAFESFVMEKTEKFNSNPSYREQVTALFRNDEGLGIQFTEMRDALDLFPKTTASEMANLMKRIQQEKLLSEQISKHIKDIMSWPMEAARLKNDFKSYGAIYDSRMGLVNGIDYGRSTYSQEPFAQAVFFDELQIAFWFHMSSNLMHQDFEQRLIWDPALRKATVQQIDKSKKAGRQSSKSQKLN